MNGFSSPTLRALGHQGIYIRSPVAATEADGSTETSALAEERNTDVWAGCATVVPIRDESGSMWILGSTELW
jgi:hypothetical protein